MKQKAHRLYRHRAYFTSWFNACPFLDMLDARGTRHFGSLLESGGYWVTYGT